MLKFNKSQPYYFNRTIEELFDPQLEATYVNTHTHMLQVLGKDLKEGPIFDRAKAADGREKFHYHPTISPLCTKEGLGAQPISKGP